MWTQTANTLMAESHSSDSIPWGTVWNVKLRTSVMVSQMQKFGLVRLEDCPCKGNQCGFFLAGHFAEMCSHTLQGPPGHGIVESWNGLGYKRPLKVT